MNKVKYKVDSKFFNKIDSEEKAYFLGLLFADGYNSLKENRFGISLHTKDKYILEKLKQSINFTGNIIDSPIKPLTTIRIRDKELVNKLNEIGVVPKKSLVLKFPSEEYLPVELEHHFIRGYFDGDGHIRKRKSSELNILGTESFLKSCLDRFKSVLTTKSSIRKQSKVGNIYSLSIGGNSKCVSLYKYLYNDAQLYLSRKKDVFESISFVRNMSI